MCKIDGTWRKEVQPGIMVRNWFTNQGFDWFTRLQVFHRVREAQRNPTAASFALSLDLYSSEKLAAYLVNEAYWNYCATDQFDPELHLLWRKRCKQINRLTTTCTTTSTHSSRVKGKSGESQTRLCLDSPHNFKPSTQAPQYVPADTQAARKYSYQPL